MSRRLRPIVISASTFAAALALLALGRTASAEPILNIDLPRDSSAATGRAGSASLAVRALLGADGMTTLELSTGELDTEAVAPGNIAKFQLKGFDGDGELVWSTNENGLTEGGHVQRELPDFVRGQPFQTQANVKGIDGARTDVITVTGNVLLRPDLSPTRLDAPNQAITATPVTIGATIEELNGDVGASATCTLLVDGVEVDRAEGIWVEGGSHVTCMFTAEFLEAGTHALEVVVSDAVPGEWDGGNNVVTGSIDVVSPTAALEWTAWVSAYETQRNYYRQTISYQQSSASYATGYDSEYVMEALNQHTHSSRFSGFADTYVQFPVDITLAQSTGETVVHAMEAEGYPADSIRDYGSCHRERAQLNLTSDGGGRGTKGNFVTIYSEDCGTAFTGVEYWIGDSGYNFLSRDTYAEWYQYPGQEPVYTVRTDTTRTNTRESELPLVESWGPTYRFDVEVVGVTGGVTASAEIPIVSNPESFPLPLQCTTSGGGSWERVVCREQDYERTHYNGSGAGQG